MLMWYSRGIYNLIRERVQGVSFEETSQGYNIILDSTQYEDDSNSRAKTFRYALSERDTALSDFQIFKDCFLNVCVSGNNTRMFNPPVEASEYLARGEGRSSREATRAGSFYRAIEEYVPSGGNFRTSMPANYSISAYIDSLHTSGTSGDVQVNVPEGLSNPPSQEDET